MEITHPTLTKWTVCTVPDGTRDAFGEAQLHDAALADPASPTEGFVGQVGGWDRSSDKTACVLSLWRDSRDHDRYLRDRHDRIMHESKRTESYADATLTLAPVAALFAGRCKTINEALPRARFLRLGDAVTHEGAAEQFLERWQSVWAPGLHDADGMLAGMLVVAGSARRRYMVATLWSEVELHDEFARLTVPVLREQADVEPFIESITGYHVPLEREWTVVPSVTT